MAQSKPPTVLSQARQAYNDQKYDDAIRLAGEARAARTQPAAATVVLARAHLERYRQSSQPDDLAAARDALKSVEASALDGRDQVELLIAFGVSLYLDDQYTFSDRFSAAAEQFEVALGRASLLDARSRDLLFDWWAGALDRQAQQGPEGGRRVVYQRIIDGAEKELASDHASASASYWLAAGARGIDDLTRASGAAVAAWIRAGSLGTRGAALRVDLDRLMVQVVLPERARELSSNADPRAALTLLEAQWRELKEKWED
ncbi:MAG: hypothetical protein ABI051_15020 [Vicinamibacterales bacterium]